MIKCATAAKTSSSSSFSLLICLKVDVSVNTINVVIKLKHITVTILIDWASGKARLFYLYSIIVSIISNILVKFLRDGI